MKSSYKDIEALFRAHFEALHRYAFTIMKDSDAAKDIVQAVFLKLLEKEEEIQFQRSAKAYLFRSVYNQCVNQIKKDNALAERHSGYMQTGPELLSEPFAQNTQQEIKAKIDGVLNQLPTQCRTVFVKSRAEQKKYKEIAAELGVSIKTVEAHMSKALKLIQASLRVLAIIFCLLIEWKK
jgi:RNA polymerase sigma-70 factor (ECF subfamily)